MSTTPIFAGKTALVTGALGTIGRKTAAAFHAQGARVILLDRPDLEDGAQASAAIGDQCAFFGCDLSDPQQAEAEVQQLCEDENGIDILVNNAALIINKPFEEFSTQEYDEQLRVNAAAAFALVRACAGAMKEKRAGKIVNLTSLTLNGRWDGYVPYVASKGAMLGLTKGLARELGAYGINVNAVAPGAVVSQAEARVFGDRAQAYHDWIIENQSLKTRIQPEDVAALIVFLCSEEAKMITGQNVGIDGGW